jgi:RimJ/RimL family protein N-acetyltransferase
MDFGGHIGTEVGWTVVADRQGQGFATEAAERVVEIAFTECGFDEIIAGTMTENVASRVVMEKLGFTYDCETEHAGLPHALYRLTKKDWEADHG